MKNPSIETLRDKETARTFKYLFGALGVLMVIMILLNAFNYDDTDKGFSHRSGMYLLIDYGTGCHWLAGGFLGFIGTPIPRLDANGKQVCRETDRRK
jgi:hypothetical protein